MSLVTAPPNNGRPVITPTAAQKTDAVTENFTLNLGATNTAGSLLVGRQINVAANSTGGALTGAGHCIGDQQTFTVNNGGATHTLMIAREAAYTTRGTAGTVSLLYGFVAHPFDGIQGTVLQTAGFHAELANGDIDPAATVVVGIDFNSCDTSAVTKRPLIMYSLFNQDPAKIVRSKGVVQLASEQEAVPAPHLGVVPNRYYFGMKPTALTPVALSPNFIYYAPTFIPARTTITRIGTRVTTAAASQNVQFAVYRCVAGVPNGAALATTSSISVATLGDKEATVSLTLEAGEYFFALNVSGGAPAVNWVTDACMAYAVGSTTSNGLETTPLASQTFGTWPTSPGVSYSAVVNAVPQIWWRVV